MEGPKATRGNKQEVWEEGQWCTLAVWTPSFFSTFFYFSLFLSTPFSDQWVNSTHRQTDWLTEAGRARAIAEASQRIKAITVPVARKQLLLWELPNDVWRLQCHHVQQTQNRSGVCSERAGHVGSAWMDTNHQRGESSYKCEVVWLLHDTTQFQNSLSSLGGGLRRHMAAATKRFDGQPRSTHLAGDIIDSATSKLSTSWRQRVRSKHHCLRIFFTTGIHLMWIIPVSHYPLWTTVLLMKTSFLVPDCH